MEFLAVILVLSGMSALFIFIGVLLIKIIPGSMDKKQSRCTQSVMARIVDVRKDAFSDSGNMYAPVYEFLFNGVLYKKSPNVYTSKKPIVGSELKLLVDPNNVDFYVNPERNTQIKKILKIIGMGMFGAAMVMLSVVLRNLRKTMDIWITYKVIEVIYNFFNGKWY